MGANMGHSCSLRSSSGPSSALRTVAPTRCGKEHRTSGRNCTVGTVVESRELAPSSRTRTTSSEQPPLQRPPGWHELQQDLPMQGTSSASARVAEVASCLLKGPCSLGAGLLLELLPVPSLLALLLLVLALVLEFPPLEGPLHRQSWQPSSSALLTLRTRQSSRSCYSRSWSSEVAPPSSAAVSWTEEFSSSIS